MPRSILLGRGWPAPGEPLFLPQDTEDALAYEAHLDALCGGCGQPREESMDPDNADAYKVRRVACHACAARTHASRRLAEPDTPRHNSDGIYLIAELEN